MKRWSRLKKKIEELFVDGLGLSIHCAVYTVNTRHHRLRSPRTWLVCDKVILWDFPGMFLSWNNPDVLSAISCLDDDASTIGKLIDQYLQTPKEELLDTEFELDRWGFTDLLKVADRRIGKDRLKKHYAHFPHGTPVGMLLRKRLLGAPCTELAPCVFRFMDLTTEITGLPLPVRVMTATQRDGYVNPKEPPTVRALIKQPAIGQRRYESEYVALEISESPQIIGRQRRGHIGSLRDDRMIPVIEWIKQNRVHLLQYWSDGISWTNKRLVNGLCPSADVVRTSGKYDEFISRYKEVFKKLSDV